LIADIFAVSALQLDMIRQLCRVYDVDFQETQGKALVTSLTSSALARIGAGSVIKLIPGLGSFIGGATVSVFAGASTYALGEVFKKHFASGGTILDFDPDRLRKYYKEKFEKGKKVAKQWDKESRKDDGGNFSDPATEETTPPPKAAKESAPKAKKSKVAQSTDEVMDKLKKLAELKNAGIITEEEFNQMKQRILDKF
ncbi:MAG: SHOCT domain-containing protein, partial [Bacteroidota bacterium]